MRAFLRLLFVVVTVFVNARVTVFVTMMMMTMMMMTMMMNYFF